MAPDGRRRVFSCRTERVAIDRMVIEGPVCGQIGERINSRINLFDRISGSVSDIGAKCFTIQLNLGAQSRSEFAQKIRWVERHVKEGLADQRRDPRIKTPGAPATIVLADASLHAGTLLDVSRSGAAISADVAVETGQRLAIGAAVGTVVRILAGGFAIQFDSILEAEALRETLMWTPTGRARGEPE